MLLRISTPAVPDDWHAKMLTIFKDTLVKNAPGEFDVQINQNAALFKQGAEPAAMARSNLELTTISAFDIVKLVPEFSVFTAGYMVQDAVHQQKIFNGPIGAELFKTVVKKNGYRATGYCLPGDVPGQFPGIAQRQKGKSCCGCGYRPQQSQPHQGKGPVG